MSVRAPVNPRRLLTWLGLLFGVGGLVLQFVLSMQLHLGNGRNLPAALGTFFSYYTILTNIVLVLIYLSAMTSTPRLQIFRSARVRGMMAANIALVGFYVYFVLRHLNALEGLYLTADTILHYVCPTLYVLWWIFAQPHGRLRWSDLPLMLAPTLVYFAYIMLRGAWVQEYPYPFMNVTQIGYLAVAQGALLMAVAFIVLSAIVIGIDHYLGRTRRPLIDA